MLTTCQLSSQQSLQCGEMQRSGSHKSLSIHSSSQGCQAYVSHWQSWQTHPTADGAWQRSWILQRGLQCQTFAWQPNNTIVLQKPLQVRACLPCVAVLLPSPFILSLQAKAHHHFLINHDSQVPHSKSDTCLHVQSTHCSPRGCLAQQYLLQHSQACSSANRCQLPNNCSDGARNSYRKVHLKNGRKGDEPQRISYEN